jgi:hypothetical protein
LGAKLETKSSWFLFKLECRKKSINVFVRRRRSDSFSVGRHFPAIPKLFDREESPLVEHRPDEWVHLTHVTTQPAKSKQKQINRNINYRGVGTFLVKRKDYFSKSN